MKKRLQIIIGFIILFALSFHEFTIPVYASNEVDESSSNSSVRIPEQMIPDTIIEYVSDIEYIILQGGEYTGKVVDTGIPERAQYDLSQNGITDLDSISVIKMCTVSPMKGTIVWYANDGQIFKIQMPAERENTTKSNCASCGLSFVSGSAQSGQYYMWGGTYGNNNFLWSDSSSIYGYGRFTNFTDTYGQGNHTLVKGDVATRGHVDNPPTGKILRCEAPQYGSGVTKQVNMRKWDIGCMPNAVLDIWKTGVEYWGYTWSSTLSINDGYYEYDR